MLPKQLVSDYSLELLESHTISDADIADIRGLRLLLSPQSRPVTRADVVRVLSRAQSAIAVIRLIAEERGEPPAGKIVCMFTVTTDDVLMGRRCHIEDVVADPDHRRNLAPHVISFLYRIVRDEWKADFCEWRTDNPRVVQMWKRVARSFDSTLRDLEGSSHRVYFNPP